MNATDRILRSARLQFGERGYAAVTIRSIAADAGVSPAMVMKVGGCKEQLYAMATPAEPSPLEAGVSSAGLGERLVRRMLQRRDDDAAEPWLRAIYLLHDAPDPVVARAEFRQRFLGRFDADPDKRRHADQFACLLLGLAAGLRTFRLLDPATTDMEAFVEEYSAMVQSVIDRLTQDEAPQESLPAVRGSQS